MKAHPLCTLSPNQRREQGPSGGTVTTSKSAHVDVVRALSVVTMKQQVVSNTGLQ